MGADGVARRGAQEALRRRSGHRRGWACAASCSRSPSARRAEQRVAIRTASGVGKTTDRPPTSRRRTRTATKAPMPGDSSRRAWSSTRIRSDCDGRHRTAGSPRSSTFEERPRSACSTPTTPPRTGSHLFTLWVELAVSRPGADVRRPAAQRSACIACGRRSNEAIGTISARWRQHPGHRSPDVVMRVNDGRDRVSQRRSLPTQTRPGDARMRECHHEAFRQGRLRRARRARAGHPRGRGTAQGRAGRPGPGAPAQVRREHPGRAQARRHRRLAARPRRRLQAGRSRRPRSRSPT